ncbi:MAG: general secretion pathway protein GspK [Sandaracinaceae bacterium]|jgi:general secretion pathway protein K|nr:general secretion pathway protein GspK [Sandaracinaceae bacterium]
MIKTTPQIQRKRRARSRASGGVRKKEGIALVLAMTAVAVLAVLLADMHESTSTSFAIATSERDALKAEMLARSSIDLTRMLIGREPEIRATVAPMLQMLTGHSPPQLPIWMYADTLLAPFCDFDNSHEGLDAAGIDFSGVQGLGHIGGECHILGLAENSKINVNMPLFLQGDEARKSEAMQLFAMMGGYQSPSPYDPLFDRQDSEGQINTRLDIVSSMIDWWDLDQDRTSFDPGALTVTSSGAEDEIYRHYRDSYVTKNAPFDSLEEVRLVRGVTDDWWATFAQKDPEDPRQDALTIYGSGGVNPNEARPEVLLSRVCSFVSDQPLCTDPLEAAKFIQLVSTVRSILPIPFFTGPGDFVNFIEGRGGPNDLYPMLLGMLGGADSPLIFRPVTVPSDRRGGLTSAFVTAARILTLRATGDVGRAHVAIRAVLNTHDRWTPPPPNAGVMPVLGIFHYWRME